jgi:trehalose/maltose hydrolase-like predicted phosphorylase
VAVAARDRLHRAGDAARLDRIGSYVVDGGRQPSADDAARALDRARRLGFDALLAEHRAAWAERWADADVSIEGDDDLQAAVRFCLFQLMASVADRGEAAVGARGISGSGYRGHVFWDTDVFVLPFLAATHAPAARAILEYRLRRLGAAREVARQLERDGARFAWESAGDGFDVTPHSVRDRSGRLVPIRTGEREEHITADVAWAAACYLDWTADDAFAGGPARELFAATARYWASRIRLDEHGRGHIYGVIGPDEYHEPVDDNAFTNVMARWTLRRALQDPAIAADEGERERWHHLADALVDGYDPATGLYEEFAGFFALEPLIISDLATRPVSAPLLLGAERTAGAQVLKQADVLMLHHLVPDETRPGSLQPNLDFYEPRTAHGSSLSPAIHAALLARTGQLDAAVEWLRRSSRIDLDDIGGSTSGGLHLATMGGVWQTLVMGFAGVRPSADALALDPVLPEQWKALEVRLRFQGSRVRIRIEHGAVEIAADPSVPVALAGRPGRVAATPAGTRLALHRRSGRDET